MNQKDEDVSTPEAQVDPALTEDGLATQSAVPRWLELEMLIGLGMFELKQMIERLDKRSRFDRLIDRQTGYEAGPLTDEAKELMAYVDALKAEYLELTGGSGD